MSNAENPSDRSKPHTLVTGASGFVGSHLVDVLVDEGCSVTTTSRHRPRYLDRPKYAGVRYVPGDLREPSSLRPAVEGQELVFHSAALFDFFARQDELYATNAVGTRNLLAACRDAGASRFVNISSGAIYGTSYENNLVKETDRPYPSDKYAASKWAAEQEVFEANATGKLQAVSLRPGAIYGPGSRYGDAKALYLMKRGFLFGKPGLKEVISSHIHVRDMARAALYLSRREDIWNPKATEPHQMAFNVSDHSPTFNGDLLEKASALMPEKGLLGFFNVRIPAWLLKTSAFFVEMGAKAIRKRPWFEVDSIDYITCGHGLSNEKLSATGYAFQYPSILDAIEEVIRWYEETGWAVFESDSPLWNET
ncbi:MAG: NAD-dependent epimerase/dehydratase family protein [Nitrospirae bacterium]|nr:NAD-dependent epimerase/dehydratase family protein [Nitrospirota bacterium]